MLERLAQNHIPTETKLKYEKAFIKRLKAWQANDEVGLGYHLQRMDQKMMRFSRKNNKNFVHS
jgi:hypothetical protein